jgi:ribose transport system permease protein
VAIALGNNSNNKNIKNVKKQFSLSSLWQRQGVLVALLVLVLFGTWRYDNFLSFYNIFNVIRYNSMIGLVALGMTFVIITGGIDLSVGSVAALSSVIAAQLSPNGIFIALVVPVIIGMAIGFVNGVVITKLKVLPFIATLAMLLAARGLALVLANNVSVSVSYDSGFTTFGQGDFLGLPIPGIVLFGAYLIGILVIKYSRFGLHVLAIGGNEEAARLMGLKVDRIKLLVYTMCGGLAALAGVILASQFGAGQPTEGSGWELSAIAAVVVGGTLLIGGVGSAWTSLLGVFLLGLIFNILNFENGRGFISLTVYWQTVIRGVFLLVVVLVQNWLLRNRDKTTQIQAQT